MKALFARLGPTLAANRVSSGSPLDVAIRRRELRGCRTIEAVSVFTKRHANVKAAKSAIEHALEFGEARLHVPMVEDFAALQAELAETGFTAERVVLPARKSA